MGRLYGPKTRLLVTGGGTGGHVIPAIELAKAHREIATSPVWYAGSPDSLESRLASASGISFFPVRSAGFVGKTIALKFKALRSIALGIPDAFKVLKGHHPDLVIGTGGYVQIPVVVAARIKRIPVVLLEPNRVVGLANSLLRPLADLVVFGDLSESGMTGIPVAKGVRGDGPLKERFMESPLKILVMGGSQGARSINRRVPEILSRLNNTAVWPIEILHQSGERWKAETEALYRSLGIPARVEGFLSGISSCLSGQSLVIARAGAMTIAEMTASGTPAIYVPYPYSAGGHQEMNARSVEERGGGWCWSEEALEDVEGCSRKLQGILEDRSNLFFVAKQAFKISPAVSGEEWLQRLQRL